MFDERMCAELSQYTHVSKFRRDVGVQHQELVLRDEVLTALCVVVHLLHVLDICRAAAHCPGLCAWDCGRRGRRPLAIVHSRRLVMVAPSSCPGDGQHTFSSFTRLCVHCATRFNLVL